MFNWYRKSAICYAYLSDVGEMKIGEQFRGSRWFTRGWTLQELIAPRHLVFLTREWKTLGTKLTLADTVEDITNVDSSILLDKRPLADVSVAQRMSWASGRQTTRLEDEAYALLGVFGISMSPLYGEGERAFRRLQEEIMRRIPDQTIFAFGRLLPITIPLIPSHIDTINSELSIDPDGFMARSPRDFSHARNIRSVSHDDFQVRCGSSSKLPLLEFQSSPYGLRLQLPMVNVCETVEPGYNEHFPLNIGQLPSRWLALLACEDTEYEGSLLARLCLLLHPRQAPELSNVASTAVAYRGDLRTPFSMLLWSPTLAAQCSPRPTLHVQTIYVPHLDSKLSHVQSHGDGPPSPFPADLNMSLAPWAAETLREQGYTIHCCRWMSPLHSPIHRLVLTKPDASFELVFYLTNHGRTDENFLRFVASSMDDMGNGFGFEDYARRSAVLDTHRNQLLNYDIDGPDFFLGMTSGKEVMIRLTVHMPERPCLTDLCTYYMYVEVVPTGRSVDRRPGEAYYINFESPSIVEV